MRAKITNNSKANQGVYTDDGLVFIEPGKARTLTIAEDYVERANALPFLKVEAVEKAADAEEPGPLDASVADLTEYVAGVDDPDEIQRLIDAETGGKSRKGALSVLEARRDEILDAD